MPAFVLIYVVVLYLVFLFGLVLLHFDNDKKVVKIIVHVSAHRPPLSYLDPICVWDHFLLDETDTIKVQVHTVTSSHKGCATRVGRKSKNRHATGVCRYRAMKTRRASCLASASKPSTLSLPGILARRATVLFLRWGYNAFADVFFFKPISPT